MEYAVISATIQRGFGVASKNIKSQLPHLVQIFPELKNIYTASINILLDKPLHIAKLERTTPIIQWWDADSSGKGFWHPEQFSIVPIKFEYPVNTATKEAWLLVCHDSAYFRDPLRFEVVTEKLNGLMPGQQCKIHIQKTADIDVG
jgi:hypothetical protein